MCKKPRYAPIIPLLTIPFTFAFSLLLTTFITICRHKILHFVSALTSAKKGRDFLALLPIYYRGGKLMRQLKILTRELKTL